MRNAGRLFVYGGLVVAVASLGGSAGCSKRGLPGTSTGHVDGGPAGAGGGSGPGVGGGLGPGSAGAVGSAGNGAAGIGGPGTGGSAGGSTGGSGGPESACTGPADPRLVLADQRILPLTATETLNTVRYLINDTEATALVTAGIVAGDSVESARRFPILQNQYIDATNFPALDNVAAHVGNYVADNFSTVTQCLNPTDTCASAYFDKFAAKAYRRELTPDEQTRFRGLYSQLRVPQIVDGYQVTFTVQEATGLAVDALLRSPQMLWRWEIGNASRPSLAPAGIPLTDNELATQLAFFLTDLPPDDTLREVASAGTLHEAAGLMAQVERMLKAQPTRDWLRTVMETYFQINSLPRVSIDAAQVPLFTPTLSAAMGTETRKFLDYVLWTQSLGDLLLSRASFVNAPLAANVYGITVPAGATTTTFVGTMLPADQRSGLLTNAGFLTVNTSFDAQSLLVPRGLAVDTVLLCLPSPGSDNGRAPPDPAQTAQAQAAGRAAVSSCNGCHAQFDPYGLALENYDAIGRYRTADGMGRAIDAHATVPAVAGGGSVANAVELAQKLVASPAFTNCMARVLLKYAMVDADTRVDVPLPPQQAGCATAAVVQAYQTISGSSFSDLVRATAASPTFALRRAAP